LTRDRIISWYGLQPGKGTDFKSAPAELEALLCELGEAKSAPASGISEHALPLFAPNPLKGA